MAVAVTMDVAVAVAAAAAVAVAVAVTVAVVVAVDGFERAPLKIGRAWPSALAQSSATNPSLDHTVPPNNRTIRTQYERCAINLAMLR